jgi:hypothetical protein
MYKPIQLKIKSVCLKNSINRSPLRCGLFLIALAAITLACFAPSIAQAVTPAPDGGYPFFNTAEGEDALFNLTLGVENTANGFQALYSNTTGSENTANGYQTLYSNRAGSENTANGINALYSNTTAAFNTANGMNALYSNTTGGYNTASGGFALFNNTTGISNIAFGFEAGQNLTTGSNNIDIGNAGVADEANTIRIGDQSFQTATFIAGINGVNKSSGNPVFIDANGQLGTGTVFPTGAIIQLLLGSPAPAGGFTKIGTTSFQYRDLTNRNRSITLDIYQKN